jgi:hypothetical protein
LSSEASYVPGYWLSPGRVTPYVALGPPPHTHCCPSPSALPAQLRSAPKCQGGPCTWGPGDAGCSVVVCLGGERAGCQRCQGWGVSNHSCVFGFSRLGCEELGLLSRLGTSSSLPNYGWLGLAALRTHSHRLYTCAHQTLSTYCLLGTTLRTQQ